MLRQTNNRLFCFSPPIMLATFIIEIGLLLWVVVKFALSSMQTRLAAVILICLATFQLAEYNVCGRFNIDALGWSRIGFVAITLLPPLGVHLLYTLVGKARRDIIATAYATAALFIYIFVFSASAFNSHICAGNYAIFQLNHHIGGWYFVYYYFWLLFALVRGWQLQTSLPKVRQKAIRYLLSGYLFFLIPTTIANMLNPDTIKGIPSVMCGFAVSFALVLVFGVMPIKLSASKKD